VRRTPSHERTPGADADNEAEPADKAD
jgi:hypothetical protein